MTNEIEQTTMTRKEAKVFQLCKELEDMKKKKKSISKSYSNEIKRIQQEIDDLINPNQEDEDEDI
jgi:hypothetical protein